MSFATNVLTLLSLFHQTAPIADSLKRVLPLVEASGAVAVQGFREGGSAIHAAKAAAPELFDAINHLAVVVSQQMGGQHVGSTPEVHTENIARVVLGLGRMTADEERVWMNRADPISNSSTSGSG